jgi:hypothetical protein
MQGRANLFTVDGEKLGACDFRGQCTLDRLDGSEVTFVQLYSDSYYTILPSVTVLVLETCKLKETIGAFEIGELQKVIAELLQPNRRLPQIAVEPPEWDVAAHQAYEEDDDIRIRLVSKLCPEAIQVHPGCVPDIDNVLVGSRIGIASIGLEQWIMLQPKESLVFLVWEIGYESTVNDLGTLYLTQGKLDAAEVMYARALAGYEKALGHHHTLTLQAVYNRGVLYRN